MSMKSMTGYGKALHHGDAYDIVIELKAVNHRFLDIALRLPKEFNALERPLKKQVKEKIGRGRVECFITVSKETGAGGQVRINWPLLDQLVEELTQAEKTRYLGTSFSAQGILTSALLQENLFEVREEELPAEALTEDLQAVFAEALTLFDTSRLVEGTEIKEVLAQYLGSAKQAVKEIRLEQENYEADYQNKLFDKVQALVSGPIHEERLYTEVALLLEKGDVSEELERLFIHLNQTTTLLEKTGPVGKEIDFLIQEMNRETNTIGSKTTLVGVKEKVILLKTLIEKMREQIQNIE